MLGCHPVDDGERVVDFADAVVESSAARTDAAEIEAHRCEAMTAADGVDHVEHTVVHAATVLRMRMTQHDRALREHRAIGDAVQCLQFARWARDRPLSWKRISCRHSGTMPGVRGLCKVKT